MSYVSVDIYVVDSTATQKPVEGMIVRVFDESNVNFFGQDTTDSSGRVGFTLFTQTYNLRFYKFGAQVKQPQRIVVSEPSPGGSQVVSYQVSAEVFVQPVANDPRLCRASGFFRDITGAPQRTLDIHFIGQFSPILLEGAGVLSERRSVRTGEDGFVWIDLIRGAKYTATVQGFEDTQRTISVPDLSSCNLPDLLFPVVQEISFSPSGPLSVKAGQSLTVTATILDSSGVPLLANGGDVTFTSSDPSVLAVSVQSPQTLELRGLSKGSASLLASRLDTTVVRIPSRDIVGVPVPVTVT